MMQGAGSLAAAGWLSGCAGGGAVRSGGASAGGAAVGATPQPPPEGALTEAVLEVSASGAGAVGPAFVGLSYEKRYLAVPCFAPGNAHLLGLFRGLGAGLLRIGGDSVDRTQWTPQGAGRISGQVAPPDVDALAGFVRGCGWRVLYGVNLATSTPEAAADEVAYAAAALGASLYGIELGNEPDLYGDYYFPHWRLEDFEARWQRFRHAILERTPEVRFTGPADAAHVSDWSVPFAAYAHGQIALLTQHYYRGGGRSPSATIATLLSPDSTLTAELAELAEAARHNGVSFRLAETNSFFSGGAPGVSDRYATALWVIDLLFAVASAAGAGANLHGGGSGYTPIADANGAVREARPVYYGLLLFTLAGEGKVLECSLSAAGLNATAYAVQRADGALSIVVVNKEAAQTLSLGIDCGRKVSAASLLALTGPAADAASGMRIQGAEVRVDGAFAPEPPYRLPAAGSAVHAYVGPLSAALIRVA
jgi:hypothetical protein